MKDRAENDVLKIEPNWEELVKDLDREEVSSTAAKIIIYGVNTPHPLPPGTILGKITPRESRKVELPLQEPVRPEKLLNEIKSELDRKVAQKIRKILGRQFEKEKEIEKLHFDRRKAKELKYGSIPGVSGKWKKMAAGGTWTIYANLEETKVLKAPHAAENSWESAILSLTHEQVAEVLEEKFSGSGLRPPGNHSVIVAKVNDSKMALAIMNYENNYVTNTSREELEKVQEMLRELYESGELPTQGFDYKKKGLKKRRNLAYRDGEYIALDLCDKSVLHQNEYLEKHRIPEKARKLGFSSEGNSNSSGLLGRFF
ncbi:MAG: hypothetical protein ABEK10_02100 [Candidatus Nanosalina sp.]